MSDNDKKEKLQRALKFVNRLQTSQDNARKKSGVDRIATDKNGNSVFKKEVKEMKKKDNAPSSSKQNPVAKHMRTFNKATVQRDRKKDAKRGYKKHSNAYENMQVEEGKYPVWNKARVALNKDKKSGKKKDYKVLSPADFLKGRKGPAENRSEEVEQVQESTGHVRMDRLSKSSQQKVINVLNVHKKNGSIDYDGTTDKGVSFKLKKPEHHSKIHSDLRKHGTGFDMHESLDNANTEKNTAQMKLRHANQKVRLAKKQEREKGAVAERKETDSAAKKPEKYTKSDGTTGTRMVPAHKEVQTESVEQVDEISDKLVKSYRAKAMKDIDNRQDKRGSNLSSRQAPAGRKKLAKSIIKTKSNLKKAKTSVFGRDKKVAKAQASRDAAVSAFKDRKDNERKINNRDRGIERTDRKADAADKKKPGSAEKRGLRHVPQGFYGESVEQVDELSVKTLSRYNDKASKDPKRAKGNNQAVGKIVKKTMQGEEVEQVDEGLLNDIRDFIVAVGASLPIKKNKRAKQDKVLEDQIRSAMQQDPEFDNLVRNLVFVRKDGVAAFKNGGKDALRKYVAKTVDSATAKKLGTLQTRWMKVKKDGTVGKASNTMGQKFKDEKDDPTKHKNVEDMHLTHIRTTERIGKIIKQVAARAKNIKEEVEQVDENMFGYEGKNKIKFYNSDAKVHKSAVGSFPDHHKAEFDKKKKTTTIHLKKSVDKDTASKVGRFNSNWQTQADYHESTDYEDVIAEALSNVVVKKMQDMVGGPDKMPRGAEFRKLKAKAQAAVKAERSAKKAAPKAVTTTKTAKGKTHKGSADASERNIIMQLRKAQDLDGNSEVRISPKRSVKLSKKKIDALLQKHDALTKPVQKRAYIVMLTKALRGMK